MESNFLFLNKEIERIKSKGWIKIPRKGFGDVGMKFEEELSLTNNQFSVPDYNGIEIKVKRITSSYPITMFSCTCDGPEMFELKRIVQKYGIKCKKTHAKFLYITLSCTEYTNWGRYLKMKLYLDRKNKKLYILITHANGKIIEKRAYWNFSTLDNIMKRKMSHLCFVDYDVMFKFGAKYAKFINADYFIYNDFEKFIDLLERGCIVVNVKFGIYRNGNREGKSYDHGTAFQIKKTALHNLYEQFSPSIFKQKK